MNNIGWYEDIGGVILRFPDPRKNEPLFDFKSKVAGFNLDNTIIESKAGMVFDRFKCDLRFQNCITKISELSRSGYSIVIISDQDMISKGFMTIEDLQIKFNSLTKLLADRNVSVIGIFTTKNNCFKKPHTWTWKKLTNIYELAGKVIDLKESFYIGNLGGRIGKKRDPDYVDRAFAHNIGIEYKTPEELFLYSNEAVEFKYENLMSDKEKDEIIRCEYERFKKCPYYHSKGFYFSLLNYCFDQAKKFNETPLIIENKTETGLISANMTSKIVSRVNSFMMIMVGPPSCGKTYLALKLAKMVTKEVIIDGKKVIKSPIVIVRDKHMIDNKKLTSSQRMQLIDNFIQTERIIIFDGNYASHESRSPYLEKAAESNMPVIFIKFDTPYQICRHFNHMKLEESKDYTKEPLSPYMFKKYNKTYKSPDIEMYKKQHLGLKTLIVEIPTLIIDNKPFRNIY